MLLNYQLLVTMPSDQEVKINSYFVVFIFIEFLLKFSGICKSVLRGQIGIQLKAVWDIRKDIRCTFCSLQWSLIDFMGGNGLKYKCN